MELYELKRWRVSTHRDAHGKQWWVPEYVNRDALGQMHIAKDADDIGMFNTYAEAETQCGIRNRDQAKSFRVEMRIAEDALSRAQGRLISALNILGLD